jgi:hypothetical protein
MRAQRSASETDVLLEDGSRNILYVLPVLGGRPLYDNAADARYFVEPREWPTLTRAIDQRNNILMFGARGAGKTTLLRQLQRTLREARRSVAFVDGTAVESPGELILRVRDGVVGPTSPVESAQGASDVTSTFRRDRVAPAGASRALLRELALVGGVGPHIILLDGSGSGKAAYELFGRLRDALWQMPHQWLVAVDDSERITVTTPPADAFFDTALRLKERSDDELVELMRLRGSADAITLRSLTEIAASAHGNPRAALRAANDAVVSGRDPHVARSRRGRLLDAASEIGRPHGMLMAELLDLGQASASDDALQKRLGVSRGRLAALLGELFDAGLVVAGHDRPDRPGRPKTVYRPALEEG